MSKVLSFLSVIVALMAALPAQGGVFGVTRFVYPGRFSLGFEPEITFAERAGLGVNFRYTHGVNSLLNVTGILGTGNGDRRFRAGAIGVFDIFPDLERQPGVGVAAQTYYYRLKDDRGLLEMQAIPYIHKSFTAGNREFDPFIALPFGFKAPAGEEVLGTFAVSVGSNFVISNGFHYVVELGIGIQNTESYFSGGVIYYY